MRIFLVYIACLVMSPVIWLVITKNHAISALFRAFMTTDTKFSLYACMRAQDSYIYIFLFFTLYRKLVTLVSDGLYTTYFRYFFGTTTPETSAMTSDNLFFTTFSGRCVAIHKVWYAHADLSSPSPQNAS